MESIHEYASTNVQTRVKPEIISNLKGVYYSPDNDEVMAKLPQITMPQSFVEHMALLIAEVIEMGRNEAVLDKWTQEFSLRQIVGSKVRLPKSLGTNLRTRKVIKVEAVIERCNRCMIRTQTTITFDTGENDIYDICFTQRGTTWMIYEFQSINAVFEKQQEEFRWMLTKQALEDEPTSGGAAQSLLEFCAGSLTPEQIAAEEFSLRMVQKAWDAAKGCMRIELPNWRNLPEEISLNGKVKYDFDAIEQEIDRRLAAAQNKEEG